MPHLLTPQLSGTGRRVFRILWAWTALLAACGDRSTETPISGNPDEAVIVEKLPERKAGSGETSLFTKLSPSVTGITFQNDLDLDHPLKRLYHSGFACGGVALGDLDGDDLPEIFFASGPGSNRLYRQTTPFQFKDITATAGIDGGEDWATGVTFADIDGDGDLDIYVCNYDSPNSLFINETNGSSKFTFREAGAEFDLALVDACLMPSFCDYDNDGDLDCWMLTNRLYRAGGRPKNPPFYQDTASGQVKVKPEFAKYYGIIQVEPSKYTMDDIGRPDYLLRNDGGKFVDVSKEAGIAENGFGLSATWWDYNEDGLMDIYVCNDFLDPDRLYKNNGDGTFTDVITETVNATPWFSMGSDAGDINNDGRLDFVALDMAATTHYKSKMAMGEMGTLRWRIENIKPRQLMRNVSYLNTGTSRFIETAQLSGIANSDWSWAAKLEDFDQDGRVDLFISNGMTRNFTNSDLAYDKADFIGKTEWDHFENTPSMPEQNLAFKNINGVQFSDVSKNWGLDHTGMSFGAAYGDLDRDGDLDLVVVNLEEPPSLYRNESSQNHAIAVQLRGSGSNTYGIGSLIRLETASGTKHVRQLVPASGFLSSNLPELVIGLGNDTLVKRLSISWPSGRMQELENLQANNRFTIHEDTSAKESPGAPENPAPLFIQSKVLEGLNHRDQAYEDFDHQPLLPNKLSQLGPGVAWADVDGDGDDDMFIGAARDMGGVLLLNDGVDANGICQFRVPSTAPFIHDAKQENMGALFFDADGDGDMDLYVANGSYEYEESDALLQDRLYVNDGTGKFEKAMDALPDLRDASSCVVGADFDRDGDVDLFVGGRVIPRKYPEPANSRLLINESKNDSRPAFVEADEIVAPGLRRAGLVTGAIWSDADNDGWVDLFVTCEWGPVKYFHNNNGVLEERTEEAGLAHLLGWWNAIAAADIDGDGDMDYAVANFGLNTKYHASVDKPSLLYYGDYAGDGTKSLVEAKYEDNVLFPVRGKSCSTSAMPHLAERFDTFHEFATAALPEIYSPTTLERSLTLKANTLESGILINDSQGRFQFEPLPAMAQVSPSFGLCFLDADADGNLDLFLAQNFFGPQFETGPYSSGLSTLLLSNGKGAFTPLLPDRSGLVVPGDATAATMTDFNGDGRLDLAVAQNDGPLLTFQSSGGGERSFLTVRLDGGTGNPGAAGAWVTAHLESGEQRVHEVHAGSGYLSQSSPAPVFALGSENIARVSVRWPNGEVTETTEIPGEGGEIHMKSP